MEDCNSATCKCYPNLWLGVKSPSSLAIAGSYRSWPQSNPDRGCCDFRATDLGLRTRKGSVLCPTPNVTASKKLGDGQSGIRMTTERGTTPTAVKVPKY